MKERGSVDFETWEWTNPLFCGFVWGPPGKRETHYIHDASHENPRQLMIDALHYLGSHRVKEWWAHNMKGFEGNLFIEAALADGWEFEAPMANNKPVTITFKSKKNPKLGFVLKDSLQVVNSKLRACANDFELVSRKLLTDDDYSIDARHWSFEKLHDGCLTDCQLVLELVERIETMAESHGGELKSTMASTAFTILRHKVKQFHGVSWQNLAQGSGAAMNQSAEGAYIGGRTEVLHHCPEPLMSEWDINSSYPMSMTLPLPWEPLEQTSSASRFEKVLDGTYEGLVCCTVEVPKQWLPPLPWAHPDGGVFFPVGRWKAMFTSLELRFAMEHCGVKILERHTCIAYQPRTLFKEFIEEMFHIKANSKGAKKQFAKLVMNSSYGKMGQRSEVENLKAFSCFEEAAVYHADMRKRQKKGLASTEKHRFIDDYDGRCLVITKEKWHRHTNYACAATITAASRVAWLKFALKCRDLSYGDTDSFHASSGLETLESSLLGSVSCKRRNFQGIYFAPKTYALMLSEPDTETEWTEEELEAGENWFHFASKGFPVNFKDFATQIIGIPVKSERLIGIKTQLAKDGRFQLLNSERTWQGFSNKRRPLPDGSTTPWTVEELERNVHLKAISPIGWRAENPLWLPADLPIQLGDR